MDNTYVRIDKNFKDTLDRFIAEFEKIYGILISYAKATKIIDEKIKRAGGLRID